MKHLFSQCAILLLLASCASASKEPEASIVGNEFLSYDLTAGLQCKPSIGLYECLKQAEHTAAKDNGVQLSTDGTISKTGSAPQGATLNWEFVMP